VSKLEEQEVPKIMRRIDYFLQKYSKILCRKERGKTIPSIILVLVALSPLTFCSPTIAQECLNTKRAKIIYDSPADLQEINRKLNSSPAGFSPLQNSIAPCQDQNPAASQLAAKIDDLLSKASGILRIDRQNYPKLTIRFMKDGQLVTKLFQLFQPSRERPLLGYGSLPAFYEPQSRTIILSLQDFHEGILAHEIAHFLLCSGRFPSPPEYYQEDLAKHVEARIN
jgi:hypothetical protein